MYTIKNHLEVVVQQMLEEYLHDNPIDCSCEKCQADIMALALNQLPARYCVSLRGQILTEFESHTLPGQARIMAEIVRAAQQVNASPSHGL